MLENLDKIVLLLLFIGVISFIFCIPFLIGAFRNEDSSKQLKIRISTFTIASVLIPLLFGYLFKFCVLQQLKSNLHEFNSATDEILVNNKPFKMPYELISQIKGIDEFNPRTKIVKEFNITFVINGDSTKLLLRSDSSKPRNHWVYFPKYITTRVNTLGVFKSDFLDEY
jgi:hypothetical protein